MTADVNTQAHDRRDRVATAVTIPDELAEAVTREAARDAENVSSFLHELGYVPTADRPVRLPAAFLLRLGAALRLLAWESTDLRVHRESGLPEAARAIREAFGLLDAATEAKDRSPADLARRVVSLFAERFAWHGRRDLDADVVLDDPDDEDALVDALAELLWEARNARRRAPGPGKETRDG